MRTLSPTSTWTTGHMVVSQNKGTPKLTPKYYSPYYKDPQKGTPNFEKPPYLPVVLLSLCNVTRVSGGGQGGVEVRRKGDSYVRLSSFPSSTVPG